MNKAFKLGKWIYSGLLGVATVLAALSSQTRLPWMRNSSGTTAQVLIEESRPKSASSATAAPAESGPKFSSLALAQKELSQAVSWNELRSFPSLAYQDLIQQLAQEEFENGQPFRLNEQRVMWANILNHGLKDYSRKIYRSPYFQGPSGYDLVHYELLLGNDSKAHLLAYREKTEEIKIAVGGQDLRPTRIDLYTQPADGLWILQSYHPSGELIQALELNAQEFADYRDIIIKQSVPLMTAGR